MLSSCFGQGQTWRNGNGESLFSNGLSNYFLEQLQKIKNHWSFVGQNIV